MVLSGDECAQASLLTIAGNRVRSLRALRGVSRKILAEQAQVSLRHLAQIEAGRGNVSIRLLGQIADALGVGAAELLSPGSDPRPQDGATGSKRSRCVSLIGLRGAGKSTLGPRLAARRQVPFLRITDLIEQQAGMPIGEIHSLSGQLGYRRYEQQAVAAAVSNQSGSVIEAGGSVVANPPAFSTLLRSSFVVWVQATPEEHMARVMAQGDLRPMEGRDDAMDDLLYILEERTPLYSQAHARLDTSHATVANSFDELCVLTEPTLESVA